MLFAQRTGQTACAITTNASIATSAQAARASGCPVRLSAASPTRTTRSAAASAGAPIASTSDRAATQAPARTRTATAPAIASITHRSKLATSAPRRSGPRAKSPSFSPVPRLESATTRRAALAVAIAIAAREGCTRGIENGRGVPEETARGQGPIARDARAERRQRLVEAEAAAVAAAARPRNARATATK